MLLLSMPASATVRASKSKKPAFFLEHRPDAALTRPLGQPLVILDPGHGGHDHGAIVGGKREKDIALTVAQKLKERLTDLPGRLTRDSDVYIPLDWRVGHSLAWGGTLFVSLHVNQVRSRKLQGITIYAYGRNRYRHGGARRRHPRVPPLPAPPVAEVRSSRALAAHVARSLRREGFRVDPPARAGYYVLKNPAIPSILIELGYLSNPDEAARLKNPDYQDRLAEALARSLQDYVAKASSSPGSRSVDTALKK